MSILQPNTVGKLQGPDSPADVIERVRAVCAQLRDEADQTEEAGRISDASARLLKDTGIIRLLQPREFAGYEADPRIFFEAVMEVARHCGASGWVSGIIGVHPWEIGVCDHRLQDEIWGSDPDVWVASTYMPTGRARRVDDGFELSGHWSFSSGIEVASWVILGGLEVDENGKADSANPIHFIVPAADYTVIQGTWDVVGLRGTGSKDIEIGSAFVPEYRTLTSAELRDGRARGLNDDSGLVYRMPWASIFPNAITAAVLGISLGAMEASLDYQRTRVSPMAGAIIKAPVTLSRISQAAGEIEVSVQQVMSNLTAMWELVQRGEPVPMSLRAKGRRDQVQAAWRAVRAVDDLFDLAGGGALRLGTPLQRLWRDAHAGLHHSINTIEVVFQSAAGVAMGLEPTEPLT